MAKIDARKLECPKPVLLTKEEADKGAAEIHVLVDNETAAGNVTRFLESRGYAAARTDDASGINICGVKSGVCEKTEKKAALSILFKTDKIGADSDGLGEALMKAYIGPLPKADVLPSAIALMNEGVKMSLPEHSVCETLKELEAKGVKILVCGTCAKHFGITERVAVGAISNMFEISEAVFGAEKPVVLG